MKDSRGLSSFESDEGILILEKHSSVTRIEQRKLELEWLKSHLNFATKNDLKKAVEHIMSAISDYTGRVETKLADIGSDVDKCVQGLGGVAKDVTDLKALIKQLQDNPGPITPEDQSLLDASEAKLASLSDRVKAFNVALAALDATTENGVTPPPAG